MNLIYCYLSRRATQNMPACRNERTIGKPTWLTAIIAVSLHYMPRCLRSTVIWGKMATTITWSEPLKMLPCYCDATKVDSKTIRSRVSQPAFTKEHIKRAAVSWLHYARTVNWLLCTLSVTSANKLSLQKKLLILRFLDFFLLSPNSQGGVNARFAPPLRTSMRIVEWWNRRL